MSPLIQHLFYSTEEGVWKEGSREKLLLLIVSREKEDRYIIKMIIWRLAAWTAAGPFSVFFLKSRMKRFRCLPERVSKKSRGVLQEAERRQNRKKAGGQAAEAPRAAWPGDFPSVYKTALFSL